MTASDERRERFVRAGAGGIRLKRQSPEAALVTAHVERLLAQVDLAEFYESLLPKPRGERLAKQKYLRLDRHLKRNIRRACDLGLAGSPPMDILDLGAGAGFFCYVARVFGHRAVALEPEASLHGSPESIAYQPFLDLFGVPVSRQAILPGKSLIMEHAFREEGGARRYDVITAFSVMFNRHRPRKDGPRRYWTAEEYLFLLRDLQQHLLKPGGRVIFDFNAELYGEPRPDHPPEVAAYYLALGRLLAPFLTRDYGAHGIELDLFRGTAWSAAAGSELPPIKAL